MLNNTHSKIHEGNSDTVVGRNGQLSRRILLFLVVVRKINEVKNRNKQVNEMN